MGISRPDYKLVTKKKFKKKIVTKIKKSRKIFSKTAKYLRTQLGSTSKKVSKPREILVFYKSSLLRSFRTYFGL